MSKRVTSFAVLALLLLIGTFLVPIASANSPTPAQTTTLITELNTPNSAPAPQQEVAGLFDGLASIFAVLGVYIVTMFTMAIAVEVVVDIFKVSIGLKSKPSARKTLAQYQNLLPGTLDDLGVSAQAQVKINQQIEAINSLLSPALQAEEVIVNLRNKEFDDAFEAAFGAEAQGKWINDGRDLLKEYLNTAVNNIQPHSLLAQTIKDTINNNLDDIINQATAEAANLTPDQIYQKSMTLINGQYAHATILWTEKKLIELQKLPYQTAETLYQFQIKPEIEKSGLREDIQNALYAQFTAYLSQLEKFKIGEEYLDSLNKLLLAVEKEQEQLYTRISRWWSRLKIGTRSLLSRIIPGVKKESSSKKRSITIDSPADAATCLMEIDERDKQENKVRINQLRFMSVLVGIGLAYFLRVDSADLLRGLFPGGTADFLYITLLSEDSAILMLINNIFNVTAPAITAGVLLTGLGASAGSNFWHQQLNRLESIKQGTDAAQAAILQAQSNANSRQTDNNN